MTAPGRYQPRSKRRNFEAHIEQQGHGSHAHVCGATLVPEDALSSISTVTWYQAWDRSDKGPFVFASR